MKTVFNQSSQIKNFLDECSGFYDGLTKRVISFLKDYGKFAEVHIEIKIEEGKATLDEIFSGMRKIYKNIEDEKLKTSSLLNTLLFFDINENKMSELIAFLLDPKEKHGQGDLFLKKFCEYFCPKEDFNFENTFVVREKSTDQQRRIDILVEMKNACFIIENKFKGATDQENQLEDYFRYVEKKIDKKLKGNLFLFYLTPDGKEPFGFTLRKDLKEELNNEDRLIMASFKNTKDCIKSITNWLEICLNEAKSYRMKDFIEDIIHFINEEDKMSKYNDEIFRWLLENKERTIYAHEIYRIWPEYRRLILNKFLDEFEKRLSNDFKKFGQEWSIKREKDLLDKDGYFSINKKGWEGKYYIYFAPDASFFNEIYYGLDSFHKNLIKEEFRLYEEIHTNFKQSDKIEKEDEMSIWWKWSEKLRNTTEVENFIRLLPSDEREKVINDWIEELSELAGFLENESKIKIEYLVKKLK